MGKNELLNKIKFMEMALEQGEKLDLMCKPSYNDWGSFNGLELFFMSENMSYSSVLDNDNGYYVLLSYSQVKNKKFEIKNYMNTFCKCDFDIFSDEEQECNCEIPTQKQAEEWWYNNLLTHVKERGKDIIKHL